MSGEVETDAAQYMAALGLQGQLTSEHAGALEQLPLTVLDRLLETLREEDPAFPPSLPAWLVDRSVKDLKPNKWVDGSQIRHLLRTFPNAKSLVLRGTHDLTAWSLRELTAHPNLRELTLPDDHSTLPLNDLASLKPQLTKLLTGQPHQSQMNPLLAAVTQLTGLESLTDHRLSHLTDLATLIEGSISASHATKLRSVKTFKLWFDASLTPPTEEHFDQWPTDRDFLLNLHHAHFTELRLMSSFDTPFVSFMAPPQTVKKSLFIQEKSRTDPSFSQVLAVFKKLAALQLPGLWNVSCLSGNWARVAANWRRLKPHLQDLDVLRFQGPMLGGAGVGIAEAVGDRLGYLCLDYCFSAISDAAAMAAFRGLKVAYMIGLRDCTGLTGASFAALGHLAPTLRSLEFQAMGRVTDEHLGHISGLTNLENPPVQVTNAGLSTLEGMSHMTRLRLTVAEPITDEGLGRLSSMTCLTTLLLSHLHKDAGASLVKLQGAARSLQELLLPTSAPDAAAFLPPLAAFTALTRLTIGDDEHYGAPLPHGDPAELSAPWCEFQGLSTLANLKILTITNANIGDDHLAAGLAGMTSLQELELLGCPNVYGPGLAGVASGDLFRRLKLDFSACVDVEYVTRDLLPSWQGLRALELVRMPGLGDRAMAYLGQHLPPGVTLLSLAGPPPPQLQPGAMEQREATFKMVTDAGVRAFARRVRGPSRLRRLLLPAWPGVGDASLKAIARSGRFPELLVLAAEFTGVTDDGILQMAGMPSLQALSVIGAAGVTSPGMQMRGRYIMNTRDGSHSFQLY